MHMVTNADRAAFAQEAVDAFQIACSTDDEDAIGDLICNLLHLARRKYGADPKALAMRAVRMNAEEREEDEEGE
jgi:hypothetical protein